MCCIHQNDGTGLVYALLNTKGLVEFYYPKDSSTADFKFSSSGDQKLLSFGDNPDAFTIYEDDKDHKVGIKINVNGKTYDWEGIDKTKQGDLKTVQKMIVNN